MSQRWATFQEMSSVRLRSFLPGKLCSTPQPETVRRWCVSGWLDGGCPTKNSGMRRCEVCSGLQPKTFTYFYYLLLFCVYRLLLPTCIHYPRKHLRLSIIPVPDIDLEDFGSALTVDGLLRLHTRVIRTRGFALDLWVQFPMYQSFLIPKKTQKKRHFGVEATINHLWPIHAMPCCAVSSPRYVIGHGASSPFSPQSWMQGSEIYLVRVRPEIQAVNDRWGMKGWCRLCCLWWGRLNLVTFEIWAYYMCILCIYNIYILTDIHTK